MINDIFNITKVPDNQKSISPFGRRACDGRIYYKISIIDHADRKITGWKKLALLLSTLTILPPLILALTSQRYRNLWNRAFADKEVVVLTTDDGAGELNKTARTLDAIQSQALPSSSAQILPEPALTLTIKEITDQLDKAFADLASAALAQDVIGKLAELKNNFLANAAEILKYEDEEAPDLKNIIIENLQSELSVILALLHDYAQTTVNSQESIRLNQAVEQAQWVRDIKNLITAAGRQCTSEHEQKFTTLLQGPFGANTTAATRMNGTALHHIAKLGKPIEFIEILARKGVNFDYVDKYGNTALLWAIANGQNAMADTILDYSQNLNLTGFGNTALHLAITKGYTDRTFDGRPLTISNLRLVQKMVEKDADLNIKNEAGYTALHLACIRRDKEMIEALLRGKADSTIPFNQSKSCQELLNLPFEEAKAILNSITGPYLLDEETFNRNQAACKGLISPQAPSSS